MKHKNTKISDFGITLTELVLVVITVSFIMAFAIPKYQGVMTNARQKTAKLNLEMIKSAQQIYFSENNNKYYPPSGIASLSEINRYLKLSIISDGIIYTCTPLDGGSGLDFECTAAKSGWSCSINKNSKEATCS